MPNRITRHSAGARLELLESGILIVRLFGPLTEGALQHVKAEVGPAFPGRNITAFVVDYTAAVVALSGDDLDRVLEGEMRGSVPTLPASMIVHPTMLGLFDGHCMRMAQHGITRRTFTDEPAALAWAARHAQRARTKTGCDRLEG